MDRLPADPEIVGVAGIGGAAGQEDGGGDGEAGHVGLLIGVWDVYAAPTA